MINRRECLALGAAALTGALLPAADKPVAKLSFGYSLYGMKTLSLEEGLKACAAIGYDAVELALMPGYHADPAKLDADARKKLRDRLGELKLSLPALMENLPPEADDTKHKAQLDRLKAAAELGHSLSPAKPPIIETILGGKPGQWDTLKTLLAKRLADWAKIAEATKTVIAIKPHRFGVMTLPAQARWLLDEVKSPWLKLVYDWSHYEGRNLTMKETIDTVIPQAVFVHVKDTVFEKDQAKFVLPGEGKTDYVELLKLIQAAGYSGNVCVEVSGMVSSKKDYDPIAAAKKCFAALAPAFGKL